MKKILLSILILASQPVFALLPPLNQSIQELEKILTNSDLAKNLPHSEKIRRITAVHNGYLIYTPTYEMYVEVRYLPQNRPGPAQFDIIFHEPIDLRSE